MKQIPNYGDARQSAACTYCGNVADTRDHVPARVLLDEPLPENLHVVPACLKCNNAAAADEEYLACLLECVICGTAEPAKLTREKIRRVLSERSLLQGKLAAAQDKRQAKFAVELVRVERVIVKLARGHTLYDLNEPQYSEPATIRIVPLHLLGEDAREEFEHTTGHDFEIWPEVGSRAMQRLAENGAEWIDVQTDRYRFAATASAGIRVRIVVSNYLACEVCWE